MAQYQNVQKINNITIVKNSDGHFGLADSSNSIVLGAQYDLIAPLCNDEGNRYLKLEKNGLIGIYDSIKVEFVQYCTMTKITKIDISQKVVKGKEPIFKCSFLKRIPLLCWNVEVDLQ